MRNLFLLALFISNIQAQASVLAIIDSGTDYKHEALSSQMWLNPVEIPDNNRDEDKNGYQDDIYGWNFAENNNQVIDYSYLGTLTADIRKFFTIQEKMFLGTVTTEEESWLETKKQDKAFLKELSVYGNFMHGTHVAGISLSEAPNAEILAVKLIPTEVKLPFSSPHYSRGLQEKLLKGALDLLASTQMKQMQEIARFIHQHKADVANGSFGTGYQPSQMIVSVAFKGIFFREPTETELDTYVKYFLESLTLKGKEFVAKAPQTLFVFAAGNEALNNDVFPSSPASIEADNVITVAATLGSKNIASFSNYGLKNVDVAAPGVGIESAAPGGHYLKVSGTSQAAPYVASIASLIKDSNPKLSPLEIKKIIMGTVDVRDFLKGKVASEGLVNSARAQVAAELSKSLSIEVAISQSKVKVKEVVEYSLPRNLERNLNNLWVLDFPQQFKF
jgi:cell wall-associated protease